MSILEKLLQFDLLEYGSELLIILLGILMGVFLGKRTLNKVPADVLALITNLLLIGLGAKIMLEGVFL